MQLYEKIAWPHRQKPKAQASAERHIGLQTLHPCLTLGPQHSDINIIYKFQALQSLVKQCERKSEFQLNDHRRIRAAPRHDICGAHLALDLITLGFKMRFYGRV